MEKRTLQFGMAVKAVMIALLLGVAGITKVNAQVGSFEVNYGNYWLEYYFNYGTTTVNLYHYYNGNGAGPSTLMIPSTVVYNNVEYTITEIGESVFQYCDPSSITTIVIPESVTTIGVYAFQGCNNLSNITIPESVTTIRMGAFYECNSLTNITIPETVITIGLEAFYGTGWYNNQADGVLYLGDCCLGYKGEQPTGVLTIQEGTRIVSEYAFIECYSLSSVVIPNSITHIGSSAFFCTSINEVTLGNSLTCIEDNVFHGCNFLTSVNIPNTVISIGNGAFSECMNLTSVTIPNSVISIGSEAFNGTNINSLTLPNSLQTIGFGAFACCFNLTGSLIIPNSVTTINTQAFHFCDSITSITIGNSVSTIGFGAFNCSGLTSITVLSETPPSLSSSYYNYSGVFESVTKSIPVYIPYGTMEAYMSAPGWNEFTNFQEMPPYSAQTIELNAGWNWCSFNLDITLDDLKAALIDALGNTAVIIKSRNGVTTYNGTRWRGSLTSLDVSQMYMIQASTDCQITLTGMPINPNECPITLHSGYNWIAFPLNESMPVSEAFTGFAINGDIIKSRNGVATYTDETWRGALNILEPGQGYIYKSNANEERTFIYPSDE